jgi:hypothetical protein
MQKNQTFLNPDDARDIPHQDVYVAGEVDPNISIIDAEIGKMPVLDQDPYGTCPFYDTVRLMKRYHFGISGQVPDLSARFLVIIGKQKDNLPYSQGTFPRIPMMDAVNIGCCTTTLLPDDRTLSWEEYSNPAAITPAMLAEAATWKVPGVVSIPADILSLREALTQYKAVGITLPVGDFSQALVHPPKAGDNYGLHRITLYGDTPVSGDHTQEIANQWGIFWGNAGFGDYLYSEFSGKIYDAMAFSKIPQALLDKARGFIKPEHTFTRELNQGNTGPEVLALQNCLQYLNIFNVAPNAIFGPKTFAAVQAFQSITGLPAVGHVGPLTIAKLNSMFGSSNELDPLLAAQINVESGGDDNAEGDLGLTDHAYGCLQIRQGVVDQVNAKLGTHYRSQDCLGNRNLSVKIWTTYWTIFPELVTNEDKAKAWNGGPGWKRIYNLVNKSVAQQHYCDAIDAYWEKVKAKL